MPSTLLDKVWDSHVVANLGSGFQLLHVDRHLVHDLSGPSALMALKQKNLPVHSKALTFATTDHCVSTLTGRTQESTPIGMQLIPTLRNETVRHGVQMFDMDSPDQGIVHVIGPELGLTLPGLTILCGDSHTCTHGALGAMAWGIGTSEIVHVLATGCIIDSKPRRLRVNFDGQLGFGVSAKDMALFLLARYGSDLGVGYAVEYAGSTVRGLDIEGRMTLCNMSIELGSRIGQVAPDDKAFEFLADRRYAPKGALWDAALAEWTRLPSDPDAHFDHEVDIDSRAIAPQITWGTNPAHGINVDGVVPDPVLAPDAATGREWEQALTYMGLTPGQRIEGTPVDHVFIGSCTNSRLPDLQAAASVVRGRKVASGVAAWVVPGSQQVKRDAEALGLDRLFRNAGFEWREPGCSMCLATNGEYVDPGKRCLSTSNRNFVGRQGPNARTHLTSPTMAAAAAIAGCITDVRRLLPHE
jgi:3-isopropylmalate/(R)-2-methylmalate dehydratase large subunit